MYQCKGIEATATRIVAKISMFSMETATSNAAIVLKKKNLVEKHGKLLWQENKAKC